MDGGFQTMDGTFQTIDATFDVLKTQYRNCKFASLLKCTFFNTKPTI